MQNDTRSGRHGGTLFPFVFQEILGRDRWKIQGEKKNYFAPSSRKVFQVLKHHSTKRQKCYKGVTLLLLGGGIFLIS